MFENTLDNYAHSNNLTNLNPYFKILLGISTMIVSLVSTSPVIPIVIALFMSILIIFKAKISWNFYLKFFFIPFGFGLLTFFFMAVFFGVGSPILELGLFNLTVTVDGFNLGFLVFTRMLGGFTCLAFIALTTPMTELFSVLELVKIPKILLELAMLMYRYIFVLLDEAINMYHTQETRLGYSSLKKSIKSMGMLGSNLFIRTWLKGEQTYIAMESRCYDGSIKTLKKNEDIKDIGTRNLAGLILFEIILVLGVYFTGNYGVLIL
ncbi:MAG TPA: cobalt ECF transporter T component CbiQ [Methanobacteriaceae archaeon]|jgi:cobalt/nickel transport system permease protein|nr:cobalt ECF transporter T component CbiQ [Euryarchaeota archaeon]HNR25378.1 cobalt ECF transporter T component CbiQ [Methanobacteriaceae archaeon]